MAGQRVAVRGLVGDRASPVGSASSWKSFAGHDIGVAHWIVSHCQLEKAVEDEISAPRSSMVEAEDEGRSTPAGAPRRPTPGAC